MSGTSYQHGCFTVSREGRLLNILYVGDSSGEDMRWLLDLVLTVEAEVGPVVNLIDARQAGTLSSDARRVASTHPASKQGRATAIFGASLAVRTLATLVARATDLVRGQPQNLALFRTEAEARSWLASMQDRARK